jgi:hypothetical protein
MIMISDYEYTHFPVFLPETKTLHLATDPVGLLTAGCFSQQFPLFNQQYADSNAHNSIYQNPDPKNKRM